MRISLLSRRVSRLLAGGLLAFVPLACGELSPDTLTSTSASIPVTRSLSPNCSTCVLAESTAPLYSAIADPDSANNLPVVASAVIQGRAGDSVSVVLAADDSVLSALPASEQLLVHGDVDDSVSLAALTSSRVVYRFVADGSVTLTYRLSRSLVTVPRGAFRLAQFTSASVTSLDAPWVAGTQSGGIMASTSVTDNPACGTLIPVNASGTFCEVGVQIIPGVPADAFTGSGARFQSDPGHGQSHTIHVIFSEPVAQVEVTIYDPTFPGNSFTARDSTGATITSVAYPGNGRPGVLTIQSASATGRIAEVVLQAASGDYVNYSMRVQFSTAACKAVVSSFGQAQSPWATDTLDHIAKTIKQRGCALTSMTSGLSAAGISTTPRDLNDLLKADPAGFSASGGINWDEAARVASNGSVVFQRFTSTAEMKKALCKGRPVIVGVKVVAGTPHHFVLVTEVNADGSFQIMDPASGSGVSRPLSFYPQPWQIRGAVRSTSVVSPTRIGGMSVTRSISAATLAADDPSPAFAAISATSARIDVSDAGGAHAIADSASQAMDIPGSTAFSDAIDDDDAPFGADPLFNASVSVPLGATYTALVTPRRTGTMTLLVQATTSDGVQLPQLLSVNARAGVPFGVDVVTTGSQATASGSAAGFVSVNRSCGATHTVSNANLLPVDVTYTVEGTTEAGALHIDAGSSVQLRTTAKGRILVYSLGREIFRAALPPGCS